jgi:NAD(P)-dependent dehydrogenase (short-subunit alcohol dehydrogenase family)
MNPGLAGKVVLVTGGAAGIGRALVDAFHAAGSTVVIADLRGAREAAASLGNRAIGIELDVSDAARVRAGIDAVAERCGGLDVLVNNAGLFGPLGFCGLEAIAPDELQRVFAVNVFGTLYCTQTAVPHLRRRGGGTIVNMASNTPFRGTPQMAHYVASKGAVVALTRAAARELGPHRIRVNAVAPGFTLSDAVRANPSKIDQVGARARNERALARDQLPGDIVGPVLFLAGEASGFMTGQTLVADGGAHFS